jgi:ornithine--oxo-acid transaminase
MSVGTASPAARKANPAAASLYQQHVNPQWVRLLNVLQMNVQYTRCLGAELHTAEGRRYLDCLSGYCVHNIGHNHPQVLTALKDELDRCGPAMVQSHAPELAGQLAAELCARAGGRLRKVFFCSSGSEGIESAIKFARAHTGRHGLLFMDGAFHGLTCGALSLMGNPFWKSGLGPMLPGAEQLPFGDLEVLRSKLSTGCYAALFLEPIQAEGGIRFFSPEYLAEAQTLCRLHGTLLVADEVQTGLHRTGRFLASHHLGIDPDIVVLAKALSGGLVPSGAVLFTDDVYDSVYGSLQRCIIHTSTYSENALAMRAGLATLEVMDAEQLGPRSARLGALLVERLREALTGFEMVRDVRGLGLFCGIEFGAPKSMRLRIPFEAFQHVHPGMFGQIVVMRLFNEMGVLAQMCGNNFRVLKVAPPLVASEEQIAEAVSALRDVVEMMHSSTSFWTDALNMARRVMNI